MIREAKLKDIKEIVALINSDKNLVGDEKEPYLDEDIEEYLNKKDNKIFVYEEGNKIVALAHIQIWKTYIFFQSMIVNKKYRGRGIASQLISHIEDFAKKKKIPLIETFTELDNHPMQNLLNKYKYSKGQTFCYFSKRLKV